MRPSRRRPRRTRVAAAVTGGPGARPRSRWRAVADWGLVLLLFGMCALLVARLDAVSLRTVDGSVRVIDGDTLELPAGRVRLKGIDAFERDQTCRRGGTDYACGAEARRELARLVGQAPAECAGRTLDRWGRLLAVCRAAGLDLNAAMVSSGWALAYGAYDAEERQARQAARGAWAGTFAQPADWRAGRGEPAEPRQDWLREAIDLIVQLFTGRRGSDG